MQRLQIRSPNHAPANVVWQRRQTRSAGPSSFGPAGPAGPEGKVGPADILLAGFVIGVLSRFGGNRQSLCGQSVQGLASAAAILAVSQRGNPPRDRRSTETAQRPGFRRQCDHANPVACPARRLPWFHTDLVRVVQAARLDEGRGGHHAMQYARSCTASRGSTAVDLRRRPWTFMQLSFAVTVRDMLARTVAAV